MQDKLQMLRIMLQTYQQATKTPMTMPRMRVALRSLDKEIFCFSSHIFFTDIVCVGTTLHELALGEEMVIVFEPLTVVVTLFEVLNSGRVKIETEAMLPVWYGTRVVVVAVGERRETGVFMQIWPLLFFSQFFELLLTSPLISEVLL